AGCVEYHHFRLYLAFLGGDAGRGCVQVPGVGGEVRGDEDPLGRKRAFRQGRGGGGEAGRQVGAQVARLRLVDAPPRSHPVEGGGFGLWRAAVADDHAQRLLREEIGQDAAGVLLRVLHEFAAAPAHGEGGVEDDGGGGGTGRRGDGARLRSQVRARHGKRYEEQDRGPGEEEQQAPQPQPPHVLPLRAQDELHRGEG